jgi:hypothetical protein
MAKPIAKKILIHQIVLKKPSGIDRDRNPTFSETVLKYVRIGATLQTIRGAIGEVKADTLTLFIDAKYTQYFTTQGEATTQTLPQEGDGVTWESNDYTVKSVTPSFAQDDSPHHWEVTLE